MRKQELIHIHGLLIVTRQHLADQEDVAIPGDAFDEYDGYGVGPTAIAKRKDAHKEAVDRLLDGFYATFSAQTEGTDALSPSSESIDTSPAHLS